MQNGCAAVTRVRKQELLKGSFMEKKDNIEIIGASENNLKQIDVSIPKGEIVFAGTPEQILNCRESKTGKYLSGVIRVRLKHINRENTYCDPYFFIWSLIASNVLSLM